MKKKIIGIAVILCIIIGIIFSVSLYAGTGKLFTNLTATDLNGIGYGIGDPTNSGKYIWHMSTYGATTGGTSKNQKKYILFKSRLWSVVGNYIYCKSDIRV